jgi:MFS transporter, MCT family, solute carrier family 16 (monocarboxylic acid transporters), member 10
MGSNTEVVGDRASIVDITDDSHEDDEHDGGVQGWLTVLGSVLVYFSCFGFINSFGFFQDFYQQEFLELYPASTIAFIGTLQIALLYVLGPIVGALFDAYGLRVCYNSPSTIFSAALN